jgi:hypothetical protein
VFEDFFRIQGQKGNPDDLRGPLGKLTFQLRQELQMTIVRPVFHHDCKVTSKPDSGKFIESNCSQSIKIQ